MLSITDLNRECLVEAESMVQISFFSLVNCGSSRLRIKGSMEP